MGAKQFVVQDALDTTSCRAGSYPSVLTPSTMVASTSLPGADRTTLRAPALRWRAASSRLRNFPVESTTMSAPTADQSRSAGSRSVVARTGRPSTTSDPPSTATVPG